MKTIQILGTGCPKCQQLTANVEMATRELGIDCAIEKVADLGQITAYGVMMTPGLAIDGEVKAVGKVLSPEQIKAMLG